MPLISGDGLYKTMEELSRRRVKLYHACQLKDLKSYLQVDGVPSRNHLASKGLPYTPFDTDEGDQQKGTWELVFFNLSDFGSGFANGKDNLPNIYGPILFCFDPMVITQALDVSITLRSAGARDFDRTVEGISSDDVPRLFPDAESSHVRDRDTLRKEFGCARAQSPEMSCFFHDDLAPLSHLAYIRLDPYAFPQGTLADIVHQLVAERGLSRKVFVRDCVGGCDARYQVLWKAILSGVRTASELIGAIPDGSFMSDWRDAILQSQRLPFQFGRYARYLFEGTVSHCV